jgi:predicted dehydrogenase
MFRRILIVGNGSIGKRHLQIAREQFPNAEISVLGHQEPSEVPEFSNSFFTTIEAAIQFAPQIAIIANPSTFHLPIANELAQRGTHLLIEKPISATTNGVFELIKACEENECVLQVGYNLRFSPSLQKFRDLILSEEIGNLLSVRCDVGQYLPTWRPSKDYRQTVSVSEALGGGVLLELSHELDYLQWIFGKVDWVRATLTRQSSLEIDVEDSAHLTLGFVSNSDHHQLIASLNMDFIRHDLTRACTAIGENGSLKWDGILGEVSIFEKGASCWKSLFTHTPFRNETYLAEWQEFITCINKGSIPSVTGHDGLRILEIVESARRSASTGAQESVYDIQKSTRSNI